jgi:hypothetical protein
MTSSLDPVEPGTLVYMHGTSQHGDYTGLAFVHARHGSNGNLYNLAGFKYNNKPGSIEPYTLPAGSENGWYGGVKREDFTVVELPKVPVRPKPGYYFHTRNRDHVNYRLTAEGKWEVWKPVFSRWSQSVEDFADYGPWNSKGIDDGRLEFRFGL